MTANPQHGEARAQVAIVADDLSGALDAAAPFAARGLETVVALGAAAVRKALQARPDVIAVSTASRELAPKAAFAAVSATLAALPNAQFLFKKIDSRLKGQIEAELAAFPDGRALIAPAIPDFGRVVRDGYVEGFGVETPIHIASRIGPRAEMADIPDTSTQGEIGDALRDWGDGLLIGARGLANALAAQLAPSPAVFINQLPGPEALFIIGSRDPITSRQADLLREAGQCAWVPAKGGVIERIRPEGRCVLVQATPDAEVSSGATVAARLAGGLVDWLPQYRTILLSGGATAEAVLGRAGIDTLTVRGECLPGLAVAQAAGRIYITKSGGFGPPDTLQRIRAMLQSDRPE